MEATHLYIILPREYGFYQHANHRESKKSKHKKETSCSGTPGRVGTEWGRQGVYLI